MKVRTLIPAPLPLVAAVLLFSASTSQSQAQQKPTLTEADYDRWEELGRATISPDGRWLAVMIGRVNDHDELRIHSTSSDSVVVVPFGSSPEFSNDSRWLLYSIGVSPEEREEMEERNEPVQDQIGLLNLAGGTQEEVGAAQSATFSADGRFLALRRYKAEEQKTEGADVVVRNLDTGNSLSFGNVATLAFSDEGHLLAMAVDAADRASNGVRLYNPESGQLRSLVTEEATYRHLTWREEAADLAVLQTIEDEAYEDTAHVAIVWRGLDDGEGRRYELDPRAGPLLPAESRIVEHRAPSWSEDGSLVFLGIQDRIPADVSKAVAEDQAEDSPDTEDEGEGNTQSEEDEAEEDEDDPPGVEIWHSLDTDPVPQQRVRERQLRQRHDIGVWTLDESSFLLLGGDHADRAEITESGKHLIARDETPYDVDAMFRQQYYDIYAVDAKTGRRTPVKDKLTIDYGSSPGGRYLLWFEGEDFFSYDLTSGETHNLTGEVDGTFVNLDLTPTREQMPSFGVAGWLEDDEAVLVNDLFDIWELRPDGSGGRRLTDGARDSVRHRLVQTDPEADFFLKGEPLYYSTYGQWTKKAGYSRARPGQAPEALLWEDKSFGGFFGRLTKAADADVFVFRKESFDDSPDYFVGGPDLDDVRQVTSTNPFQEEYAWGTSQLIDYENEWGRRLQGALFYPANYEPGKKYPMIVHHYELLSQTLHSYTVPDAARYYNSQVWSQEGYFVLQPDIVYRDRRPGQSNVETLRPAVAAAVETGMIDPERVGLIGHSWGGYQTTFFVTQDDLFASAVAGAPLTNLMSMYLSFYWNSGGTDARIFEISQGRMQVPWWEDYESYEANSPVHHIEGMNTPLLMAFGTEDGAVEFNQGVEFYNAARRAGKNMVLLVYEGENHGLVQDPNRRDYQSRILQWFGHYLKGEPAPEWITKGVPYLEQKDGLKKKRKVVS